MNLILWLVLGGLVGWLASRLLHTGERQRVVLNVAIGTVGAFFAGWYVAPLLGIGTIDQIHVSPASVLVSVAGAAILLLFVNVLHDTDAR